VTTLGFNFLANLQAGPTSPPEEPVMGGAGGVPYGPLPPRYAFLRSINPSGSGTNCVNCAAAVDQVLGGPKIPAEPGAPTDITVLGSQNLWQPGGRTLDGVISQFQGLGAGSRGIVFGGFNNSTTPGHVFNIENYNGVVYLLDGQSGGIPQTSGFDYFLFLRTN
jgi:hypothetical protein